MEFLILINDYSVINKPVLQPAVCYSVQMSIVNLSVLPIKININTIRYDVRPFFFNNPGHRT